MGLNLTDTWVYLAQTPLLWLTATLVLYQVAYFFYQRANFLPLLNPMPVAVALLVTLLLATHTPYQTYFDGAQFVHFLLGPATVALAIPLYNYYAKLKQLLIPVLGALLIGSTTAIISAVGFGWLFGLSHETLLSLAPKSITTPIAMGVSEQIGGLPSLTAVLVIFTGIIGATMAKEVLDLLHIQDNSICGFAMGLSSHGLGTARAFQLHDEAGAFSGLAMGLNGLATAILTPILIKLMGL